MSTVWVTQYFFDGEPEQFDKVRRKKNNPGICSNRKDKISKGIWTYIKFNWQIQTNILIYWIYWIFKK